jgi:hypothetical protein
MVDIFTNRASPWHFFVPLRAISLIAALFCGGLISGQTWARTPGLSACRVESRSFEGWRAEELSNPWVKVTIVPQLGGRVMQVTFAGHAYLFVNPKYRGQYILPTSEDAKGRWINYGGDKIWPMPEEMQDEQHWAGPVSDALDDKGIPYVTSSNPEDRLHYMEAEVNSPMVRLQPGETYALDTHWFPTRMGKEFKTVTDAGVVGSPLAVSFTANGILLSGIFGVFMPGKLEARFFDRHGVAIASIPLQAVSPSEVVELHVELKVSAQNARVSLHVMDAQGNDQGSLGEARVSATDRSS